MAIFPKRNSLSVLLMLLGAAGAYAQSFTIEGVTYSGNASQKTCFIQDADPTLTNVSIPQSISYNSVDYQVVSIGFGAFTDCAELKAVSIPASVTSIGNNAFNGCTSLASLTFDNSTEPLTVGYSHDYASGRDRGLFSECPLQSLYLGRNITNTTHRYATFSGNDELTDLTISETVTDITASMFSGCSALENISIPASVQSIGSFAFSGCSGLTSVALPSSLTTLGESAFYRCSALSSISIPSSLTTIETSVFGDCQALENVIIPEGISSIGNGAFSGCSSLIKITIPQSVTSLGSNIFSNCSKLTAIVIPSGVKSIEMASFSDCSSLTSIELSEAINTIGALAFSGCKSLHSITIHPAVTTIGNGAFSGCSSLTKLNVISGSEILDFGFNTSALPALFAECPLEDVYLGRNVSYPADAEPFKGIKTLKKITIGSDVPVLDGTIFTDCSALAQLTLENGETEISTGADGFSNCPIATINLGRNFKLTDGHSPFAGMSSIKKLTFTASATEICEDLFRECLGLTWISFPETVKNIAGGAFADCASLEGLTFEDGSNPIVISAEGAFSGSPIKSIYLGRNLSADIAPFSGLNLFKHLTIGSGVTSIAPRVFRGCPGLSKVTIEQGYDPLTIEEPVEEDTENTIKTLEIARNILGCGFRNFYNLNSVTVYDGITTIGANLFEECTALKSISLPNSVISIGNNAFANCSALQQVILPKSLCAIGDAAFSGCRELSSINLPESLTSISSETFARCSSLSEITLPSSIVSIGELAFADCPALVQLTIADSTDPIMIDNSAFRFMQLQPVNDSPLKEIYLGRDITFDGPSPFAEINNLRNVTVGNSVETLPASLFQTCYNLEKVKFGTALKSIEDMVFFGCGALRSVRCESLTPPSAFQTSFPDDAYRFGTLYVPDESMQVYLSEEPWDLFRQVSSEPESEITNIKANQDASIYNLQGLKLSAKPSRGLYIQGGKKVIL